MIKVKDRFIQHNIRHHRQKQKKHTKFLSHDVIVKGLNMKQKVKVVENIILVVYHAYPSF